MQAADVGKSVFIMTRKKSLHYDFCGEAVFQIRTSEPKLVNLSFLRSGNQQAAADTPPVVTNKEFVDL